MGPAHLAYGQDHTGLAGFFLQARGYGCGSLAYRVSVVGFRVRVLAIHFSSQDWELYLKDVCQSHRHSQPHTVCPEGSHTIEVRDALEHRGHSDDGSGLSV